jgi:hypothetical protein
MSPDIETILNSPVGHLNQHLREQLPPKRKGKIVKARNDCPEVQWIGWKLKEWCEKNDLLFVPELKFHRERKFRFDFAIFRGITESQARKFQYGKENIIFAIEYEGIFSTNSRHTNKMGYSKDTDKYRLAAMEGWVVLRYTKLNYQSILEDLEKLIK